MLIGEDMELGEAKLQEQQTGHAMPEEDQTGRTDADQATSTGEKEGENCMPAAE